MRKHIIAIGGGGFGRKNSSQLIEEYLLSISGKDYPKICFLPTATGDNDSYIVRFYSIFTRLKCIPSHIEFWKNIPKTPSKKLLRKKVREIIYRECNRNE